MWLSIRIVCEYKNDAEQINFLSLKPLGTMMQLKQNLKRRQIIKEIIKCKCMGSNSKEKAIKIESVKKWYHNELEHGLKI